MLRLALLLLSACLPLQWIVLAETPVGSLKPFHLAVAVLAGSHLLSANGHGVGKRVASSIGSIAYTGPALMVVMGCAALYSGRALSSVGRDAIYLACGLVVGSVLVRIDADRRLRRAALWSAPVAVVSFLVAAQVALPTSAAGAVARSIQGADPAIVQYEVLRPLFQSSGLDDVGANLRHSVFVALWFAVLVSFLGLPAYVRSTRATRMILAGGGTVAVALVLVSLSRTAIVAMVLPLLIALLRPVFASRVAPRYMVSAYVVLGLTAVGFSLGFLTVVSERFGDTASYSARSASASAVLDDPGASLLSGRAVENMPHNFVLNQFVSGGVVAGVLALMIAWKVLHLFGRCWGRWMRLDEQALLLAGAFLSLPLVRMFTASAGLGVPEWASIVIGAVLLHRTRRVARPSAARSLALAPPDPLPKARSM